MFETSEPNVPQISPEKVKTASDSKQDVIILDVRTTGEYAKSHIENSINLPIDEVSNKITSVIPDKNKTIYVYCLSGSRSVHAVDSMQKLGYKNVYDMPHGLLAWRINKFPLVN